MLNKKMLLVGWLAAPLSLGVACKQAKYEFTKRNAEKAGPDQPIDQPKEDPKQEEKLPPNHFKGEANFEIKGTPDTGKVGQDITFDGTCGDNAAEELTWQFGDGQSGKGNKVTHRFGESRKFVIDASCKDKDGKERRGSIIIYIAPADNGSGNPNQNNPGQKPNQSNPGQG